MRLYRFVGKRILDTVVASAALLALSPLLLATALAIWLEDRQSPLYWQERVGRRGQLFRIVKFRSMPTDTPSIPSVGAATLRVTRVGRVIRRTNVDELPQLWNVLCGDMSLVGPRPAMPAQTVLVEMRRQRGVELLAPGLTGLAQVNSYDGMPESEKVEWDARYAGAVTLLTDMRILFATLGYLARQPPVY